MLTTVAGVTMAGLLTVRWMVAGYLAEAERVGAWRWLRADGYSNTEVLVTRFGDEVIAALLVAGVVDASGNVKRSSSSSSGSSRKKGHRSNNSGGAATANATAKTKAVIRAWTVCRKYRGKGVGAALLGEAVKLCRHRGWSPPVFAADHANSARVLPALFNAGFEARERRARDLLERVVNMILDVNRNLESRSNGNGNGGKAGKGRR